jgi:circadian clock protein KaiB
VKPKPSTSAFQRAARPAAKKLTLRLYIAGSSDRSTRAIQNAKEICDQHVGNYELDVIDIYKQPTLAKDDQIVAVPTLIKKLPLPLRRIIGDLSDRDVVLVGLDLKRKRSRS